MNRYGHERYSLYYYRDLGAWNHQQGNREKLVFRNNWVGELTNVFCFHTDEPTNEQIEKKGLQESEINWESSGEPEMPQAINPNMAAYEEVLKEMKPIISEMNANERASKDIAW